MADDLDPKTTLAHGAHQHHLLLHMGIERSADVVAWADRMLWAFDDPPPALIDVSLAQEMLEQDLAKLLEPLMTVAKDVEPLRPALGLIARRVEAGESELYDVIRRLAEYGVSDNTGSRWLPHDMHEWLGNLLYECINIHYVYPSKALLDAGVRDIFRDVVTGLRSLAQHGTYGYALRPAVHRAKTARDAELKPSPRQPSE